MYYARSTVLQMMLNIDPISCARYARENSLLKKSGWKRCNKYASKLPTLVRMAHHQDLKSYHALPNFKFGIQVPANHREAMKIDDQDNNTQWLNAEYLELKQLDEYHVFDDLGSNKSPPEDHKKIPVHFVYDVKFDGRRKAMLVAGGHLTDNPVASVYSSVASLKGLRLVIFIAELNGMKLWTTDVGNAYLEAETEEKVYIVVGHEFEM